MKFRRVSGIYAVPSLAVLVFVLPAITHAAHIQQMQQVGFDTLVMPAFKAAWTVLADFMREVWRDTVRIVSAIVGGVIQNILTVLFFAQSILERLIPGPIKKLFVVLGEFLYQIFHFLQNLFWKAIAPFTPRW